MRMLEMVVPEQVLYCTVLHRTVPYFSVLYCTVPEQVILGEMASLHCIYDMEGEELYSVKWWVSL